MLKLIKILCIFILCIISMACFAQEVSTIKPEVQVTFAKKLGTTMALKHLVPMPSKDLEKRALDKRKIKPQKNFIGRHPNRLISESKARTGPDRIRQSSTNKSSSFIVEPLVNIDGQTSQATPQDPTGDVGENYYMQAVNATSIALYDKISGELVSTFAANTLWSSLGFSSDGDPIILFDQNVNRWLITEFAGQGNNLLVAISLTEDPMGEYDVYNFTTPNFPDYPKYGIWNDSYTVTTNEQGSGVLHAYFINRQEMLDGQDIVRIQRIGMPGQSNTEAGFYVATPVDWSGHEPPPLERDPIFLATNDASWNTESVDDALEIFSVNVDWDNEANTTLSQSTLTLSPFDGNPCVNGPGQFPCIPQLNGNPLDGVPEVIMNQSHYRNFGSHESIVLNFITDVTDGDNLAGIRWIELRRTISEEWTVYQEGTYSPDDGLHRFMGGIAMDGAGNIGLGYNVSSPTEYVGVRFTGRRVNDPLGTMTVQEFEAVNGKSTIFSGTRFGDYAHMSIDPFNDKTFWYTSEYAGTNATQTRIVSFEIRQDTFDISPVNLVTPINSSSLSTSEVVEFEVRNFGLEAIDKFDLGYILDNGTENTESVEHVLLPGESYSHRFNQTADLSLIGDYKFKIFTSFDNDANVLNDTVTRIVRHLPQIDLAVLGINNLYSVCGSEASFSLDVVNLGTNEISEASLSITLNGDVLPNISFVGQLESNGVASLELNLTGLINGSNALEIDVLTVDNINGDEILINNHHSTSINAIINGFVAELSLLTDFYPDETSWNLVDENGVLVAEGGPYVTAGEEALIIANFCLDPELCYTFTLIDSYGDGISGFGISGTYTIFNDLGAPLVSLIDADFGFEEANDFCAEFICMLEVDADVSVASSPTASDGLIMIDVINGAGPFMYSIDNGTTFQSGSIFRDLPKGEYSIVVTGAGGCTDELVVELLSCELEVAIIISPETLIASKDGSLEFVVSGNLGPFLTSINGGSTLSSKTEYQNLAAGDYEIIVRDSLGCEFERSVHLGNTTATEDVVIGTVAKIYPNPTEGQFRIELIGVNATDIFIPIALYNIKGEAILRSQVAKYDDGYLGIMSLHYFPQGLYYLKIENDSFDHMIKIVRI